MRIGLSFREPLLGDAVACLLESRRPWSVCYVVRSAAEALVNLHSTPIDVLLVDTLGLEAEELQALLNVQGAGGLAVALIVAEADAEPYLDLPIERIVLRCAPSDDLFAALDDLARPRYRSRSGMLPFDMSHRELECAQLVARGLSNRRIAELTGLREQSVKNVVSLAMRKLSVENRVQIALRLSQVGASDSLPVQAVVSISVPEGAGVAVE